MSGGNAGRGSSSVRSEERPPCPGVWGARLDSSLREWRGVSCGPSRRLDACVSHKGRVLSKPDVQRFRESGAECLPCRLLGAEPTGAVLTHRTRGGPTFPSVPFSQSAASPCPRPWSVEGSGQPRHAGLPRRGAAWSFTEELFHVPCPDRQLSLTHRAEWDPIALCGVACVWQSGTRSPPAEWPVCAGGHRGDGQPGWLLVRTMSSNPGAWEGCRPGTEQEALICTCDGGCPQGRQGSWAGLGP